MIVVDVESTGMTPDRHSLLSVGAVDFGSPKRIFYGECRIFEGAHVDDEALNVCGFTRQEIVDVNKDTEAILVAKFIDWSSKSEDRTLAGQNTSFDRDFLFAAAHRAKINWQVAHRTIDLHSVCYADMIKKGFKIPISNNHSALNLDAIMEYCGLPKRVGKHNALSDAKFEAECFSRIMLGKPLLGEFENYKIP